MNFVEDSLVTPVHRARWLFMGYKSRCHSQFWWCMQLKSGLNTMNVQGINQTQKSETRPASSGNSRKLWAAWKQNWNPNLTSKSRDPVYREPHGRTMGTIWAHHGHTLAPYTGFQKFRNHEHTKHHRYTTGRPWAVTLYANNEISWNKSNLIFEWRTSNSVTRQPESLLIQFPSIKCLTPSNP